MTKDLAASVRARLLNLAKAEGSDLLESLDCQRQVWQEAGEREEKG